MPRAHRPLPLLDQAALERLALRYVERFATTRAKLAGYLRRKIVERGWDGERPADITELVERFAELRYVDDRAFAEARASALTRRGMGARRVDDALRQAGIDEADRSAIGDDLRDDAEASALAYARRRRIGPYARETPDRAQRERQVAAMVRAGHSPSLARRIVAMDVDDASEALSHNG